MNKKKLHKEEIENAQISSLNRLPDAILALKSKKIDGLVIENQ